MNTVKPAAARKKPLSDPMIAMLRSASAGLPLTTGLRGRSEHGGAVGTEMALKKRGLLDRAGKLTADGYGELAKWSKKNNGT